MIVLEYILLAGLIVCAAAAPLCRRLLASVIVYMSFSLIMAVLWSLLQSPDLAITEAAVGAGVTSILFFLTLKKIRALAAGERQRDHDRRSHADEVRHGEVDDHERHGEVHGGKGGRAEVLTHEDAVEGLVEGGCEHADGAGYGGLEEETCGRGLGEELVRGHRAPPSSASRRSLRRSR